MPLFRITIKKDHKKCAQFDLPSDYCEGAIKQACKIYFGNPDGNPTRRRIGEYEYICQQIKNEKGDHRIYPVNSYQKIPCDTCARKNCERQYFHVDQARNTGQLLCERKIPKGGIMAKKLQQSEILQRVSENEALIIQGAKQQVDSILNIGLGFKQMKDLADEVGWQTLGYENFGDYTERRWNINEKTAYNYVQVIEKLPSNFFLRVRKMEKPLSFRRLLALPAEKSFWDNLTQAEFAELAGMSDAEFNDKKDGWQARYQKQYRENQLLKEQQKTLQSELQIALDRVDVANHEIATLKISEHNEKILKITQERDNVLQKLQEISIKLSELEARKLTQEQAFAAIKKHVDTILCEVFDLTQIKLEPEMLPYMWTTYLMIENLLKSYLAYILDKMEINPSEGAAFLKDIAKEINPNLPDRLETGDEIRERLKKERVDKYPNSESK